MSTDISFELRARAAAYKLKRTETAPAGHPSDWPRVTWVNESGISVLWNRHSPDQLRAWVRHNGRAFRPRLDTEAAALESLLDWLDEEGKPQLPPMSASDAEVLTRAAKLAYERSNNWWTQWDHLAPEVCDSWRLVVMPLVADLERFVGLTTSLDERGPEWAQACQDASEDAGLFEDA